MKLTVEVMGVRWSVPEGDFAVLDAVSDQGQEVVLISSLAHVQEGESLVAGGGWQRHARHGWQFAVQRVRIQEPVSEQAVAAYLESIKHVGPRGAATLVERFGAGDVLAAIDRDPERVLGAVPGIGPRRLPAAADSWRGQRELRELLLSAPSERGFVARIDRNATPPAGPTRSVGLHSAHGIAPPATA